MPTRMKNASGTEINEKVEPLTESAKIAPGLNVLLVTKELPAYPIAARMSPRIVPIMASPMSCTHTIPQSALPISSANVCADGLVITLIY
jgi:hypothetical protein